MDPSSKLTEPGIDGAIPDPVEYMINATGLISESELTLQLLSLCGLDIEQWVKDRFAGNYDALAKCMNALDNLEQFNEAVATNIADAAKTMFSTWTGHAAQAAKSYFDQLANGIADFAGMIGTVRNHLQAVCVGIQQAAEAIALALGSILDVAAEAIARAMGSSWLQEVPGVDVLADIWTSSKAVEVIKKIAELAQKWNFVQAGLEGASGLITTLVGTFSSYHISAKLPSTGYANASQGGPPDTSGGESGKEHGPR